MDDQGVLWEETVQAGAAWSHVLKRGTALRILDIEGNANVGAVFYNFECPPERYTMADTLKGRVLCSITEYATRWRDSIGGCSMAPAAGTAERLNRGLGSLVSAGQPLVTFRGEVCA